MHEQIEAPPGEQKYYCNINYTWNRSMSNNGSPTVDMMMKILNLYTLEYQKRTSFTAIDERFYFFLYL